MKILHTSDWHIGHMLYTKRRYEEHQKFLDWLKAQIFERDIDALIVSGDIFDTGAPGGTAQKLYYDFLLSIVQSSCKTVVVVAGNHDSPRLLEAPSGLLKSLNIHVVGLPREPEDHVIFLCGADGETGAICCAVPYLRKNEMVRIEEDGLSSDEKIITATRAFYRDVTNAAIVKRTEAGIDLPIIATGHLFAAGATTQEGDGVRELYVGSLGQVGADIFPQEISYVALGHVHSEQTVSGKEHIRYCGSPLHMSFSEIDKQKYVIEIDSDGMQITKHEVPIFQKMKRISGRYKQIMQEISSFVDDDVWLEITYTGEEMIPNLAAHINDAVEGKSAEVLSIRNNAILKSILKAADETQTLKTMKVQDVFLKCIDQNAFDDSERDELISCFNEIVAEVEENDACE